MERNPPRQRNNAAAVKTTSRFDEAAAHWDNNPGRVELARAVGTAIVRTVPL